jgi:xanthine dehydrogenase accessory factor
MQLLRDALTADGPLALATVIATSGSTPRHPGARMLVDAEGRGRGTIGGGRIELEVCRAGAEVASGGPARRVRHHLVRDLAMCCGGTMELYLEPVAPSRAAIEAALELERTRGRGTLIHDLGGGPIAVVSGPPSVTRPTLEAAADGARFLEPIEPSPRAVLFGAGHVGRALGPLLATLGFQVVLCDDGDTDALEPAPGFAAVVVDSFDLADVERAVGRLGAGDHAIIVTRDHAIDERILEACFARPELTYLGLIGSRGKLGRFRKRLVQRGVPDEAWARLRSPIGLDLGAETPAEIAVAVAAELIAERRGVATRRP